MLEKSERKHRKTVNILEVNTDSTSMAGVLRKIQSSLEKEQKIFITTPNPEIILKTLDDQILRKAINDSDIKVPDGIGLAAAAKFLRMREYKNPVVASVVYLIQGIFVGIDVLVSPESLEDDLNIIKGRSLFLELIKIANKKEWKVYFLGGIDNTSCRAKAELNKNYKRVIIKCSDGPLLDNRAMPVNNYEQIKEKEVMKEINKFGPDILFVGFGAPKQEKWIEKWKENIDAGVLMVVGGAIDYYSGKMKLPPKWVDSRRLEWLWRLIVQPRRFLRIFNAVVRFSWKVYLYKIKNS